MDKLLPCPFCGGENIKREYLACDIWEVMCNICYATGPRGTRKVAFAAWNRRVYASRDAEVEALRAELDAEITDLNSLTGKTWPCHICEFEDMIRCCHYVQCGASNLRFKWRAVMKEQEDG